MKSDVITNSNSNQYDIMSLEEQFKLYDSFSRTTRDLIKYHQLNISPLDVSKKIDLFGLIYVNIRLYNTMNHKKDYSEYVKEEYGN